MINSNKEIILNIATARKPLIHMILKEEDLAIYKFGYHQKRKEQE